jgi:choline-sulfatase
MSLDDRDALANKASRGPNILFIAVDDLRPELGCYGNKHIKSPNIDRLAKRGVTFTRAYCQQAVCNPSRASLMTGLRPDSTRVWDLVTHFRDTIPDVVTLPQYFRKHGYYAVAYGKIYHNSLPDLESWDEPNHWPKKARPWSAQSRQRLAAYRSKMRKAGATEAAIRRMRAPATDDEDVADNGRPDGEIADQAIAALKELANKDQSFFLAVGFIYPHLPWTAPRRYWELYDADQLPLADNSFLPKKAPPMAMNTMYELRDYMDFADTPSPNKGLLEIDQRRRLKHGYYAAVSFVDAQIGRLLAELDRAALRDETIVVLWGDHGWKLGEHGSWCKQTNYELDVRVPLILHAPRARSNGRTSTALVEFIDIYPTLCELAGLQLPKHLQGESLVPLLQDPTRTFKEAAFSQFRRWHEGTEYMGYAMRTGRYRYVEWLNRRNAETVATELYDHESDPQENTNIAGDPRHSNLVSELSRAMRKSIPRPSGLPAPKRPVIRFRNALKEAVEVFWIAPGGNHVLQGRIDPGKTLRRNTTRRHQFLVRGTRTDYRLQVVVTREDETITLRPLDGTDRTP